MVEEARKYFKTYSDKQRTVVKDIIRNIRKQENEADRAEEMVKRKLFHAEAVDPVTILHLVRRITSYNVCYTKLLRIIFLLISEDPTLILLLLFNG